MIDRALFEFIGFDQRISRALNGAAMPQRGNNAAAQCGFSRAEIAAEIDTQAALIHRLGQRATEANSSGFIGQRIVAEHR